MRARILRGSAILVPALLVLAAAGYKWVPG
jgi:hypothetical protein